MLNNQVNNRSYSYIVHPVVGKVCARIQGEGVLIQPKVAFQGPVWEQKLPFGGSGYCGFSAVVTVQQATELGFNVETIRAGRKTEPTALPAQLVNLSQPVVLPSIPEGWHTVEVLDPTSPAFVQPVQPVAVAATAQVVVAEQSKVAATIAELAALLAAGQINVQAFAAATAALAGK